MPEWTAQQRAVIDSPSEKIICSAAAGSGKTAVMVERILRMLREGKLAGAALDVFEQEPIPADDPLWDCPNLVITPHMAGNMTLDYTTEKITDQFLEDLDNYAAGRPLKHTVDRKRAY